MLNLSYQTKAFSLVAKPVDLFKELGSSSESIKVKLIYDTAKSIFGTNSVLIEISEGDNIYRYNILSSDYKKQPLGYFVYIPKERRLDVWITGEMLPLLQYKGKTIVFKNFSGFLDKIGLNKLFDRFSGIL